MIIDNRLRYNACMAQTTSVAITKKLKHLPTTPGVYFFRDAAGKIIYIGKASILKRRVSSYFQTSKHRDFKTRLLVENIGSLTWTETGSEVEALFLEAELIKRYKPFYNIRDKDDKNFIYLKITTQDEFPVVSYVRRPSDDRATYFGPFVSSYSLKTAMKYLRRIFPYITDPRWPQVSALNYQIGLTPPPDISKADYRRDIRRLMMVLEGKSQKLVTDLEREMRKLSRRHQYEQAAVVRNQFLALKSLSNKMIFGREESFDVTMDQALTGLTERLGLKSVPRRIEAYDISNFAGGDAVASMVVFTDGVPHQSEYRRFKMRSRGPNDFAMMAEAIRRRFSGRHDWRLPELVLIDGGKGQLSAALAAMSELGLTIPTIGLAKRIEEIIAYDHERRRFASIILPKSSKVLQLLQRVRDEAHRFAVSYHTVVRDKRTKASQLDSIPGIGPVTRKQLIRAFGSVSGVKAASEAELQQVVGKKAKVIKEHIL